MKGYWRTAGALLALLTVIFLLFEALQIRFLQDPTPTLREGGLPAAALGVGLLVADVLIPVPSSLLMVAHGALFGVWIGTLLSLLGSVGAALVAFSVGRAGGPLVDRLVSPEEKARADRLIARWGALAVIVSRPIPLLAEAVAILAGASPLSWSRMALAALAGSLPPALLYALTGALTRDFASAVMMFAFVLLMSGLFWLVGRRLGGASDPDRAS